MILLPYSSFIFQKSTSFWILFKLTGLEVIGSVTHTCFIKKKNLGRDKWAQHKRVVTWWELSNRNHCNLFYQNPLKTIDDVEAQMEYCQISLLNGLWQNLFNVLSDLNEMNKWATSANESGNVHGIPYNWLEPERKKNVISIWMDQLLSHSLFQYRLSMPNCLLLWWYCTAREPL